MKTKPSNSGNSTSNLSGSVNSSSKSRKSSHSKDRERDKKRSVPSGESGASSQCDTPPLSEKDNSSGKFAGISPESVQYMGEQVLSEQLSTDVCSNLAEDVSYKLRQLINNVALHARQNKIQRIDVDDVNTVLTLMDTEPVLGPAEPQWVPIGDTENLCTTSDPVLDVTTVATQQQNFLTVTPPTLSTVWITDSKNLSPNSTVSPTLQNYYIRMSKAILCNNKRLVRVALNDLSCNTRIGPVVPNFVNLCILVLSDEAIPVLAPTAHQALHIKALNMLEALLLNPSCSDTDVTLQLQRLFPILVSNVLTESSLSEQMCRVMAAITTRWPQFSHIGRSIVLDYLSQGVQERLSAPLVNCLTSLGRQALVEGLLPHLGMIEAFINSDNIKLFCSRMYGALLSSAHVFLKPEFNKFSTEMALIDEILYDLLGDSLVPHRIHCLNPEKIEEPPPPPKMESEEDLFEPPKVTKKKIKFHIVKHSVVKKDNDALYYENVFDVSHNFQGRRIIFHFAGSQAMQVRPRRLTNSESQFCGAFPNGSKYPQDKIVKVIVADGLLARFKYRLPNERRQAPRLRDYAL